MYNNRNFGISNYYRHPGPEPKHRRFLTAVNIEKFTVNLCGDSCIEECCEPVPVGLSVKKSALIISSTTHCIEQDTYYTFDLDRSVPIDWNALQVFLKAERCEFSHKHVGLEETEITLPYYKHPHFRFTEENICKLYQAKYQRNGDEGEHCHHERHREEEFIEVDLDLRGNIATSGYFLRNERGPNPAYGPKHRYVLYMNNAGRLVLARDRCETLRYGDFDL